MKISMIIPAYNAASTICETLDSILEQTRQPDQVIVVDDGSTDSTAQLAKQHPLHPTVIRLSKNQGQPAAINKGIQEAQYEFLTFLDADDLWTKNKLLLQQTFFQKNPDCDLLFGMMQAFICPSVDEKTKARLQYKKGIHPGYSICTMMIKKKMTLLKGFNETLLTGSFIDLYARAKHLKLKIDLHTELFVKRRIRPNTLSRRVQGEKNDFAKNFLQLARNQIIRKRESVSINLS